MKGFKDSNNKFHPITDYKKGVRKSRDQSAKTQGVKIRKQRVDLADFDAEDWWDSMGFIDRKRLISQYEPRMVKNNYFFNYDMLSKQIQNWIKETIRSKYRSAYESGDVQDSGEIPPNEIYDSDILEKLDGRYFLVKEGHPDTLAVDEYTKVGTNLFKHERTVYFSQDGEETQEILRRVGGGAKSKSSGYYGLANEMKFLRGLKSAGALDG
ncbi:MAG: hypothetical protein KJI69_05510 [Patescibacteria group bacterium]|nr:hypothetical protein [Patescibacteria group bacterium]